MTSLNDVIDLTEFVWSIATYLAINVSCIHLAQTFVRLWVESKANMGFQFEKFCEKNSSFFYIFAYEYHTHLLVCKLVM